MASKAYIERFRGNAYIECKFAEKFFYLESLTNFSSKECPNHASCSGGKHTPKPDPGWWVDRRSVDYISYL